MAASFILGLLLARFNVFGALVATAICAVSSFICVVISNLTLAQALVVSLAMAFVLQVGYLVGQFLCNSDLGLFAHLEGIRIALFREDRHQDDFEVER